MLQTYNEDDEDDEGEDDEDDVDEEDYEDDENDEDSLGDCWKRSDANAILPADYWASLQMDVVVLGVINMGFRYCNRIIQ